jgi:hypothetical protein
MLYVLLFANISYMRRCIYCPIVFLLGQASQLALLIRTLWVAVTMALVYLTDNGQVP